MTEAYSLMDEIQLCGDDRVVSGLSSDSARPVPIRIGVALVLAVPLSSSSPYPERQWASLFPQSSTVHSHPPEIQRSHHRVLSEVLPPTAEQLAVVQAFFGLAKTQLATVCGVQRQTIYDWYASNFEAEDDNADRLARLYKFVQRMQASGHAALSSRVVSRALSSGTTLLDLLRQRKLDEAKLGVVVAELSDAGIKQRARGAAAARERLGWQAEPDESSDLTLEANLEDFVDG